MFDYIDSKEKLIEACDELKKEKELAIDLECENNLHHYGTYIALIQISSKTKNYIVDLLALENVKPLVKILEDSKILKVFHDVDFDFRMLSSKLDCHPKNVFDTQIAAMLLGKEKIGLGDLMEKYFNIKKIKKFQMADWTKRPLSEEMLSYAIGDTTSLLKLKDVLKKELKDRLPWAEEEFKAIEKKEWPNQQGGFDSVKGYSALTDQQRAVVKRLFSLRKKFAQKVDRPVHFVFNNKKLISFATEKQNWHKLIGVHPIVKRSKDQLKEAISKGRTEKIVLKISPVKRFAHQQKMIFTRLNEIQEQEGKRLGIAKHLIMNKDQMVKIVVSKSLDSLKNWQKELVKKHLADVLERS